MIKFMRTAYGFLFVFSLAIATKSLAQKTIEYLPRYEYGQRLEPKNKIISGAGQAGIQYFNEFIQASDSVVKPEILMDYYGLEKPNFKHLEEAMQKWKSYPWPVIPQIGLAMTHDGNPEKHYEQAIAEGKLDKNIEDFANMLSKYEGNVMVRLGYEFNGHWNGYRPDSFKLAYQRVAKVLREKLGERLALVWCMAIDGDRHDFANFYPGDEYVDWWSVDIFGEKHFTHPALKPFLEEAHKHKKPVLIGECTPRKVSVQLGQESVNRWFRPFFELMASQPGIKGFSYIYWDWSKTRWAEWGDGRFGENPITKKFVVSELKKKVFQH